MLTMTATNQATYAMRTYTPRNEDVAHAMADMLGGGTWLIRLYRGRYHDAELIDVWEVS